MHKKLKKFVVILMAACIALAITGCKTTNSTSGEKEQIRLMVWSSAEDQSKENGEWLQNCCERFAELHPEWDITFVYGVADSATAPAAVAQDPEASADVFFYANDNLPVLDNANAIAKIGGKYAEEIKATNSKALVDSLTVDGNIYGVPFGTNTWFMYYDKSVFSEDDVKNLDTMLEKGVVSFPLTNSWYTPAFYFGNGCTLFGDGTQEELGADFGNENAVEVTEYLVDLVKNPNFRVDQDGSGIAGIRDGSISAMFSGSWDAAAIKDALGDNMGVAALPTYTLNGEEKQMYSFAGSTAIGVNTSTDYMVASVELAIYLSSAEAQMLHYELRDAIPCNTEIIDRPEFANNEVVMAQNDTFDRTSKLQPFVSKMNNFWAPMENMGKGLRNSSVTKDNAKEQTVAMNDAINSDGI